MPLGVRGKPLRGVGFVVALLIVTPPPMRGNTPRWCAIFVRSSESLSHAESNAVCGLMKFDGVCVYADDVSCCVMKRGEAASGVRERTLAITSLYKPAPRLAIVLTLLQQ